MKKNMKNIVIYSIIGLLCIFAAAEYIISKTDKPSNLVNQEDLNNITTTNGPSVTAAVSVTQPPVSSVYDGLPEHVKNVMLKSIETPDPNPTVGIGRGKEYASVTATAITNAGGLQDIVKDGDVVLIKPNLCIEPSPDSPRCTDYRVVQEIVNEVKELGASRVIIAESSFSGNVFNERILKKSLYGTIEGVELFNFNDCGKDDCYALRSENGLVNKDIYIPKVYMDADVVITVAKMKTHQLPDAVVSLCLKNCYGVVSTQLYGGVDKEGIHAFGIKNSIVEINRIRKPDFAVIDGIVGGEGFGPVENTAVDSQIIIAGKDLVAVDTVGATFMGFAVDDIPHLKLAGETNLGITDLSKINIVGADLDKIKMSFKRITY